MSSEKSPSALFPEIPRRLNELDQLIATGGGDARLRVEIDDAMKALSDTVSQLRSRRNACSPLLRLPGELLSNVLLILEDD
ncbi:hypothetical protein PENSPDRAFT_687903 [Peniophora sp. CONT]|nr:hypothetical protein PENSPDRAFT_687903 [Peniophora sp. CONT]